MRLLPSTPLWWEGESRLSDALLPLSSIYSAAAWLREGLSAPAHRASVPVVCVGGAVAGGSGKTPVVLALAARLLRRRPGLRVHLLTRGYGGREHGPLRVHSDEHTAQDVGDESLLLAKAAPTWVAAQRSAGARAACAAEPAAELLLMDDGLQHHTLHRDASLLVIDAEYLLGNNRVLPAGPLREPFERTLARADAIIALTSIHTGKGVVPAGVASEMRRALRVPPRLPIIAASLRPDADAAARLAGRRVLAFSGTARPHKFFRSLESVGCELCDGIAFPDHQHIGEERLDVLERMAASHDALLVTTEKDAVRVGMEEVIRRRIDVLPATVEWCVQAEEQLDDLLLPLLDD